MLHNDQVVGLSYSHNFFLRIFNISIWCLA